MMGQRVKRVKNSLVINHRKWVIMGRPPLRRWLPLVPLSS
jgi:hypothetical protein